MLSLWLRPLPSRTQDRTAQAVCGMCCSGRGHIHWLVVRVGLGVVVLVVVLVLVLVLVMVGMVVPQHKQTWR